jgi:hypothetical protein
MSILVPSRPTIDAVVSVIIDLVAQPEPTEITKETQPPVGFEDAAAYRLRQAF